MKMIFTDCFFSRENTTMFSTKTSSTQASNDPFEEGRVLTVRQLLNFQVVQVVEVEAKVEGHVSHVQQKF